MALETSAFGGSAAALDDDHTLAQLNLPRGQRSAQGLAPVLQAVLHAAGWRPRDVNLVAVTQGPGSFTGLRVGAVTAKTFAYAVGAEVLGVDTLEAIACQAPPLADEVWALLDAYRGQLFVGRFRTAAGGLPVTLEESHLAPIDTWLERVVAQGNHAGWVMGPGIARIADRLPAGLNQVEPTLWAPQAATVGRLARQYYLQGRRDTIWSFAPHYLRPSAAEERIISADR